MIRDLSYWRVWLVSGICLVLGIVTLSLIPEESYHGPVTYLDKYAHALAYGVLTLYFAQILVRFWFIYLISFLILLGTGLEFVQPYFHRSFELLDLYANLVGIVLGSLVALLPGGNRLLIGVESGLTTCFQFIGNRFGTASQVKVD